MKLRLFCALPVPTEVQMELTATITTLKEALSHLSVSWAKTDRLHLTLSFLGDVDENRVEELGARLRISCDDVRGFEVVCRQLGCFPNPKRPRIIWAGVEGEQDELQRLQSRVSKAVAPFVSKQETTRFQGHITLGRVRLGAASAQNDVAELIQRNRVTEFGRWRANSVELWRSDLSQSSPHYSLLKTVALGA